MLREKSERLEVITENVGVAVAQIYRVYRTIWANGVTKKLYKEVEGKNCHQTNNQQDNICSWCGVHEVFENGKEAIKGKAGNLGVKKQSDIAGHPECAEKQCKIRMTILFLMS